eukprot:6195270-Pleurochrysis_carterae.AAC.1
MTPNVETELIAGSISSTVSAPNGMPKLRTYTRTIIEGGQIAGTFWRCISSLQWLTSPSGRIEFRLMKGRASCNNDRQG